MDKDTKANSEICETPSSDGNDVATDKVLPASKKTAEKLPVKSCLLRQRKGPLNNVRFNSLVEMRSYFPENIGSPFASAEKLTRTMEFLKRKNKMGSITYQQKREHRIRRVFEANAREHPEKFAHMNEVQIQRSCRGFIVQRDRYICRRLGLSASLYLPQTFEDRNEGTSSASGDCVNGTESADGTEHIESADGAERMVSAVGTEGIGSSNNTGSTASTDGTTDTEAMGVTEGIAGSTDSLLICVDTGCRVTGSTGGTDCSSVRSTDGAKGTPVGSTFAAHDITGSATKCGEAHGRDTRGLGNWSPKGQSVAETSTEDPTQEPIKTRVVSCGTTELLVDLSPSCPNLQTSRKKPKGIKSRLARVLAYPFRKIGRFCSRSCESSSYAI